MSGGILGKKWRVWAYIVILAGMMGGLATGTVAEESFKSEDMQIKREVEVYLDRSSSVITGKEDSPHKQITETLRYLFDDGQPLRRLLNAGDTLNIHEFAGSVKTMVGPDIAVSSSSLWKGYLDQFEEYSKQDADDTNFEEVIDKIAGSMNQNKKKHRLFIIFSSFLHNRSGKLCDPTKGEKSVEWKSTVNAVKKKIEQVGRDYNVFLEKGKTGLPRNTIVLVPVPILERGLFGIVKKKEDQKSRCLQDAQDEIVGEFVRKMNAYEIKYETIRHSIAEFIPMLAKKISLFLKVPDEEIRFDIQPDGNFSLFFRVENPNPHQVKMENVRIFLDQDGRESVDVEETGGEIPGNTFLSVTIPLDKPIVQRLQAEKQDLKFMVQQSPAPEVGEKQEFHVTLPAFRPKVMEAAFGDFPGLNAPGWVDAVVGISDESEREKCENMALVVFRPREAGREELLIQHKPIDKESLLLGGSRQIVRINNKESLGEARDKIRVAVRCNRIGGEGVLVDRSKKTTLLFGWSEITILGLFLLFSWWKRPMALLAHLTYTEIGGLLAIVGKMAAIQIPTTARVINYGQILLYLFTLGIVFWFFFRSIRLGINVTLGKELAPRLLNSKLPPSPIRPRLVTWLRVADTTAILVTALLTAILATWLGVDVWDVYYQQ